MLYFLILTVIIVIWVALRGHQGKDSHRAPARMRKDDFDCQIVIPRLLTILRESQNIVDSSKNADTVASRKELIQDTIARLSAYDDVLLERNGVTREELEQIVADYVDLSEYDDG